jgi:hypothetical protein
LLIDKCEVPGRLAASINLKIDRHIFFRNAKSQGWARGSSKYDASAGAIAAPFDNSKSAKIQKLFSCTISLNPKPVYL